MGDELQVSVGQSDGRSSYDVTEASTKTLRLQRRVLFASQSTQWPISAMLKAAAFANYLAAELIVLQVSESLVGRRSLFWHELPHESIGRWAKNLTESTARCNYILPGAIPSRNLFIRHGDFVREVVTTVSETGAVLVVMPADKKGSGLLAMDIAYEAKVPVLVARPPRSHNIVLAATKLTDGRYPVLNKARQIGGFMGAQKGQLWS
jgi:nucleotide-binding universal stress UspA family protein